MNSTQSEVTLQSHSVFNRALATYVPDLATKADLAKLQSTLTWRIIIVVSIATAFQGLLIRAL